MFLTFASALALAQLSAPATLAEDRLRVCLDDSRRDPPSAITEAQLWLEGLSGAERSYPLQCLGFSYMALLRWDAAQDSFTQARDARLEDDAAGRARLGTMAGNAALAAEDYREASLLLTIAHDDAVAAGQTELAGTISAERARAFVGLGETALAAGALEDARMRAPQVAEVWLLSATLARRMDDLESAQSWIETASLLAPEDPGIGVEAGLIAAMGGFDDAARATWESVMDTAPGTPQAAAARNYLAQLNAMPALEE